MTADPSSPPVRAWLVVLAVAVACLGLTACDPTRHDDPQQAEARQWIIELRGGEPARRAEAARQLARIRAPGVVDALVEALGDPVMPVRLAAVEALAQHGGPRAEAALIGALEDSFIPIRLAAMSALGELNVERAIDPLIAVLDSPRTELRLGAIDALAELGEPAAEPLMKRYLESRKPARGAIITALGRIGHEAAIPMMIAAAEEDDHELRLAAAEALGHLGHDRGIAALIALLAEPLSEADRERFERRRQRVPPEQRQPLRRRLIDEQVRRVVPDVERAGVDDAGALLRRLSDEKQRIEQELEPEIDREAVEQRTIDVKGEAAWAGWDGAERQRQVERMIEVLTDAIRTPEDTPAAAMRRVRMLAMLAEARIQRRWWGDLEQDERERRLLREWERLEEERRQDIERDIRRAAVSALENIGSDAAAEALVAELGLHGEEVDRVAETLLRHLGTDVETPLVRMVRDDQRRQAARRAAVDVLVARGETGRLAVVELMRDDDPELRRWAAAALFDENDPALLEAMIALAGSGDRHVRRTAVNVLGRIGDPAARSTVRRALDDEDMAVKLEAVRWIGVLGERRAIGNLRELIARYREPPGDGVDESNQQRRRRIELVAAAVRSLSELGGNRSAEAVRELLDAAILDQDEVLYAVADAAARFNESAAIAPLAEQGAKSWRRQMHIAPILGRIGDPAAVPILMEWAHPQHQVQDAVVEGLARIPHSDAVEALIELARADDGRNLAQSRRIARALARQGERAIAPLSKILNEDDSAFMRALAAEVLAADEGQGVGVLIEAASEQRSSVRLSAIHGLAHARHEQARSRAREHLVSMLGDEDRRIREAVYWALGQVGDRASIRVIDRARQDESSSRMQRLAEQAIEKIQQRLNRTGTASR